MKCSENKQPPVKIWQYRNVFDKEFNLSFYHPKTDTCKCDMLNNAMKMAKEDFQKKELSTQHELHLHMAEQARTSKHNDISACVKDNTKYIITFDLQKMLPTPYLNTNVAYYKHQYWTFNLGIHNCVTGEACMNMWGESIASCGADEIASCILHHVRGLPSHIKHIIAYSDIVLMKPMRPFWSESQSQDSRTLDIHCSKHTSGDCRSQVHGSRSQLLGKRSRFWNYRKKKKEKYQLICTQ